MLKMSIRNIRAEELAAYQVVLSGNASSVEVFAAEELSRYLAEAIGIALSRGEKNGPRTSFVFEIVKDPELRYDGFRISFEGETVRIQALIPRGFLNAVYTLLEENGFRWCWLKSENEIVPKLKTVAVREEVVNPDIEFRGVCIFSVDRDELPVLREIFDWLGKNRYNFFMSSVHRTEKRPNGWKVEWFDVGPDLYPELEKRGIVLDLSEHSGRYFFPVSHFEKHPEWFAMNAEGVRHCKGQLCYSNEDAVTVLSENYARYAKEHPEVDIMGVWPEDGYGFCQCEKCRTTPGVVLKAVNRVAEAIENVRPDLWVEYLSYTKETSDVPPEILPRKNMVTLVANPRVAEEWKRKSDQVGALGVYRLHYRITDNTAARGNLSLRISDTLADCREAVRLGLRGIVPFFIGTDTWWRSTFNLYFLSQFCWNTELDPKALLRDLCHAYFPSAENEMFELFSALEHIPIADQSAPLPWPLWQHWTVFKTEYSGEKWKKTCEEFASIRALLERARARGKDIPERHFISIAKFIDFQETMFKSWHFRALAVAAFERNDPESVRKNLRETGRLEQGLIQEVNAPENKSFGVCGAWPDYDFFLNWRLQLDKQLYEMRTDENKSPLQDDNPDVELFLPALLGM